MNKYLIAIIVVLVGYILLIPPKVVQKTIEIPSKQGEKIVIKPIEVVKYDTIYREKEVVRIEKVKNELNEELLAKYNEAKKLNDSLLLNEIFKNAIKKREYKEQLNDSNIIITVNSKTTGYLDHQKITYNIKPQRIVINKAMERMSLYFGGYTYMGIKEYSPPAFGLDLSLMDKKRKKIIKLGYDTNQNAMVGISFKIF